MQGVPREGDNREILSGLGSEHVIAERYDSSSIQICFMHF